MQQLQPLFPLMEIWFGIPEQSVPVLIELSGILGGMYFLTGVVQTERPDILAGLAMLLFALITYLFGILPFFIFAAVAVLFLIRPVCRGIYRGFSD